MADPTPSDQFTHRAGPLELRFVLFFGAVGLIVSWFLFSQFVAEHGLDFGLFISSTSSGDAAGLVWDLVACGWILTAMTMARRAVLGTGGVIAVLLLTWILGVCVGLAAFVFLLRQRE